MKIKIYRLKKLMLLITGITLLFSGCKKETVPATINSDNFIHTYPLSENQWCWYIRPTDDNGILVIGTEDLNNKNDESGLLIIKTNEKGEIQWKNKITTAPIAYPVFRELSDGSLLISGLFEGNLCKLDKDGKVVFITNYGELIYNSAPVQTNSGDYLIALSRGYGPGTSSQISIVKPDGKYDNKMTIMDASFGNKFKVIKLNIAKCDTFGNFKFFGLCWPNWDGSFNSKARMFVAEQRYSGTSLKYNKLLVLDSLNQDYNTSNEMFSLYTKDKKLVILGSEFNYNNVYRGHMVILNENHKVELQKNISIGSAGTYIQGLTYCEDGNFLISGYCWGETRDFHQPFACKVDTKGNILWSKIYSTLSSGALSTGFQTKNGNYIFGGNTSGFGKSATGDDFFILKTDKEGDLK